MIFGMPVQSFLAFCIWPIVYVTIAIIAYFVMAKHDKVTDDSEFSAPNHVGGGHVAAVGELGALAQGDLVLGVGDLDGLTGCQRVVDLVGVQVKVVEAFEHVPGRSKHERGAVADGIHVGGRVGACTRERARSGTRSCLR